MLGPDGSVIEPGGDGVRERDLAVLVLQNVGEGSLQDARDAALEARGVLAKGRSAASGFDADQFYFLVFDEVVENSYRV